MVFQYSQLCCNQSDSTRAIISTKEEILLQGEALLLGDLILCKRYVDQIVRRCVPSKEMESILRHCHSLEYGGHFNSTRIMEKVIQSRFYWLNLFKDAHSFELDCDRCQRLGNISRRNEMPLNTLL